MIRKIVSQNKAKFIEYNELRKSLFVEYSPRDSEFILYLLPWLLSVNQPECPGYIRSYENPFTVCLIDRDPEIKKREEQFKEMFGVVERGPLLLPKTEGAPIEGIYTIGSIGTISQTYDSDCDIWLCYDKRRITAKLVKVLHQKISRIGEWLDRNCRIPVHFFVLEIEDIVNCMFGSVDEQSSGSTQTHVLKEEFYRTCVVLCGKIPLWWVCYDIEKNVTYELVQTELTAMPVWAEEFIDMGNLESVDESEYFGAALWQLNKALDRPLKSIIKMLLLKMQLDAFQEELICHKFRQHIMIKKNKNMLPDPSIFSMIFILGYYQNKRGADTILFIKECFYLRCGLRAYSELYPSRRRLEDIFINQILIDRSVRERLDSFSTWDLESQIRFGKQLFNLLLDIYRDISKTHSGVATKIDREDLTVIGRKLQIFYEVKDHKVSVLPKVMDRLNTAGLTLHLENEQWHAVSGVIRGGHLVSHPDILYVTSFIVKNDLFDPVRMHMLPNSTSVSLPEIQNVAVKIRDFIHLPQSVERDDYLRRAVITRLLIVISFEEELWDKTLENLAVVYKTSWGEVYVRRFFTEKRFREFLMKSGVREGRVAVDFYLQKKCNEYVNLLSKIKKWIRW